MYLKSIVDEAVDYVVGVLGPEVWEVISKCWFFEGAPANIQPQLCGDGKYHLPVGLCRTLDNCQRFNIYLNFVDMKEYGFTHDVMIGTCVHEIIHAVINYYGVKPVIYSEVQLTSLDNFCGGKTYGSRSARAGKWSEAICEYMGFRRSNKGSQPMVPAFEGTIEHLKYGMKHPVRR